MEKQYHQYQILIQPFFSNSRYDGNDDGRQTRKKGATTKTRTNITRRWRVDGIVVQERQVDGRQRGRNNHSTIMQPRRMERVHEDRDGGVKLKIPPFCGTADSEAYLQWERKIERACV